MSEEKGDYITTPTDEFEWLLDQGNIRSIMVSTSDIIPDGASTQPPHAEAYQRYKKTADQLDAELVVTMEHPDKQTPKRLVINIDGSGAKVKKPISSPSVTTTTQRAPRVG
jgi:hypothetical protein